MSNVESSTVETNGITLHYYRTGGAKPPVVLSHGITDSGLCWTPVAERLAEYFDVIMYDARGHGRSDAPEHGYTVADYAADLIGLVRALGLERPMALGHSLGGSTIVEAATTPGLFRRVILEDPPLNASDGAVDTATDDTDWIPAWRDEVIANKRKSREELMQQGRIESPSWSDAELDPWADSKQQVDPRVFEGAETIGRGWRKNIPAIQCPILLMTGGLEAAAVTPAAAQEARNINPQLEVVHFENAGHNIRRDAFEEYMRAVEEFLTRIE